MWRNVLDIGRCPTPNNSNSILNILLVTNVTIKFIVGAFFPSFPRSGHQMARCAKVSIMLNIVVGAKTGEADPHKQDDKNSQHYNAGAGHSHSL
jgi:hypothetical protein